MRHSERSTLGVVVLLLLVLTTYTYILVIVSSNAPLFAQVSTITHGRISPRDITVVQNVESGSSNNRTRGVPKNFSHANIEQNITGLNSVTPVLNSDNNNNYNSVGTHGNYIIPIRSSTLSGITAEGNNGNISSQFGREVRIALVEPTFTAAAYNNSFYVFYQKYSHTPAGTNITSNIGLLSHEVIKYPTITPTAKEHSAFAMLFLLKSLRLISPESDITILTDADVDNGSIFEANSGHGGVDTNRNAYDVIILGHQEYVTQQEYDYLKNFVSNGGTMILLDGNVFYAQVKFDRNTDYITLVKGHGWAFNGKSAWRSVNERWAKETSEWVGSNYLCYSCEITFANDPWEYQHHEEQYVSNPNDKILFNYNASLLHYPIPSLRPVIATYELSYHKGKVISFGIYSDDIIANVKFDKYFNNLVTEYIPQKQQEVHSMGGS
jgi:hypothetical protein